MVLFWGEACKIVQDINKNKLYEGFCIFSILRTPGNRFSIGIFEKEAILTTNLNVCEDHQPPIDVELNICNNSLLIY